MRCRKVPNGVERDWVAVVTPPLLRLSKCSILAVE